VKAHRAPVRTEANPLVREQEDCHHDESRFDPSVEARKMNKLLHVPLAWGRLRPVAALSSRGSAA
jgi:hypothetical protein